MANRVELTGRHIVIESVCGGAEQEGGFYLVSMVCVCAEEETIFFFQMTGASNFVSRRWLRLLNTDNSS
jgi:hypothetical protein